ncbi:MAG: efflux RND transporter periplasmic adaptor subunit [Defluviitaleaceae bacterium]|nr:efflux RND transporter periplasmic adaptor subunit [Defluviitaleaceae bacterium]
MEKDIKAIVPAESEAAPKKKRSVTSIILGIAIGLIFIGGGVFAAVIILAGQRTISTGNASVTTDLIHITANMPGYLERFSIYSGMNVEAGQTLGWIQDGESFRSPVDGIVVRTSASEGQQIRPMESLAAIADINNLHIQANIYESDIQDIRLGQPVSVTLDGVRGQTFAGYVRYISRITELELVGGAIMVQTGTFRRITKTVPVEIVVTDDVDLSLFLGTNARVSIPVLD